MQSKNKHGLDRQIPNRIKCEVRKRCGSGCVVCGDASATYEHFFPPFQEALEHCAEGITLLCNRHKIGESPDMLSREQVAVFDANPFCIRYGAAFSETTSVVDPITHSDSILID